MEEMTLDTTQEIRIVVLQNKVDRLEEKQVELLERLRVVEKWVIGAAAVLAALSTILAFIGAGYFAPKAEAMPTHAAHEWISKMKDWKAKQTRLPIEVMINNSLEEVEMDYGSYDPPKPEVVLQFPSDEDRQGIGWGYDRCHHRSWIRFIQERTGKNCRSGHTREKN